LKTDEHAAVRARPPGETVDLQGSLKICDTDLLKIFGTDIFWESKRQPYGLDCFVQPRTDG
jgi:hypothetical protein